MCKLKDIVESGLEGPFSFPCKQRSSGESLACRKEMGRTEEQNVSLIEAVMNGRRRVTDSLPSALLSKSPFLELP